MSRKLEKEFQDSVISIAQFYRWRVAYFHKVKMGKRWITPVGADGKGWLDLILCHEEQGIIIARELKIVHGRVRPDQETWIRVLNACGVHSKIWTPKDMREIQLTLEWDFKSRLVSLP